MKTTSKLLLGIFLMAVMSFTLYSCGKNDTKSNPRSASYSISAYDNSGITGNAMFKEVLGTDSVMVTIVLKGGNINNLVNLPVSILNGTALEDGKSIYDLGVFKGSEGKLTKEIALSFDKLEKLDGGIAVYDANGNAIARGEIGMNKTFKKFPMKNMNDESNGEFRIYKRDKGSYLVVKIDSIPSTCRGVDHPARVYNADGSPDSTFTLMPVSDANGVSGTKLPDHDYKDLINYQGFIKVLCSQEHLDVNISRGDF